MQPRLLVASPFGNEVWKVMCLLYLFENPFCRFGSFVKDSTEPLDSC